MPSQTLRPQQPNAVRARSAAAGLVQQPDRHRLLALFLITLVIPVSVSVAGLRLTPARVLLLLAVVPVTFALLSGKRGKIIATDIVMGLFTLWVIVSLLFSMGPSILEFAGITGLEIWGSYALGRYLVHNRAAFLALTRFLVFVLIFIIIEAMAQSVFHFSLYDPVFSIFGDVFPWPRELRLGLLRASSTFEHPILYGVLCASTFSLLVYAPRNEKPGIKGWRIASLPGAATFFSLSVGAWLPLLLQIALMGWDYVFRKFAKRWVVLISLFVGLFVLVDLASNRTPFEVFISLFTLDPNTSYWRILIFKYAIDDVWQNPLFGIGLRDWSRPHWMYSSSVDNLWLLTAMRYGFPGLLFFMGAYFLAIFRCVKVKSRDYQRQKQQTSLVFTLVTVGIAVATVHLWGATFLYFCFLLGTSNAFSEPDAPEPDSEEAKADPAPASSPYTRAPLRPGQRPW
ncbi:O-antigen ligase family protein [Epibacterium ulvae]|uniref:O-antigen ligase family protein n=1 Tax=Epibacterium ulvae TaxID=1156985 RepID=UPI001BFC18C6|nr:O-antigen ligase family protein [Epibacterium ulvae]MBT8154552.1 O-antigen ligase family protein [Epibacterium ulvae]